MGPWAYESAALTVELWAHLSQKQELHCTNASTGFGSMAVLGAVGSSRSTAARLWSQMVATRDTFLALATAFDAVSCSYRSGFINICSQPIPASDGPLSG
jgi:hypothetical protein